tara:strand:- start:1276 stop:1422 length:147 start_codon:yes stop_codon:yes gene_type:complete
MANSFEILKAKVSATNDVLKRKKVGVTIYLVYFKRMSFLDNFIALKKS